MYDFVDDFQNYDIKPKILTNHSLQINNKHFCIYIKENETFPNKLLLDRSEFTILTLLNLKNIMKSLRKSYNTLKIIRDQFVLDISRSYLYINEHKINNLEKAMNYLEYTYPLTFSEILILCTQSIFVPVLEWLYQTLPGNYIIGELELNNRKKIILTIDNHSLVIKKNLRIFTIYQGMDITVREIQIKIVILEFDKLDKLQLEITFL